MDEWNLFGVQTAEKGGGFSQFQFLRRRDECSSKDLRVKFYDMNLIINMFK